ncbi:transglutaminase-like cysteine peptidase [Shewanella sp. 202IG2-18]|uniref:transglutaminase-like cysteine peptidase n=1 Tax=Parashewanella hymeniacidonis TaxID=2807618 RepID=UPI0019616408|nr:transglutaminase-like cysteine peptidase [Parashewanella hymeniacidonis]MBM7071237.1 transglutaminase-like cysteine peptidase [Parashewanella hymeniacidonis]
MSRRTGKYKVLKQLKIASTIVLALLILGFVSASQPNIDRNKTINTVQKRYGERAGKRTSAWFNVIDKASGIHEKQQLEQVNRFFNLFNFVDDIKLWGQSNYWATPMEFIGVNGGDCEDFSIAKYFTLLQLGVPEDKMRITMVKANTLDQYHMVLAYYETPSSIPLILDNLDKQIKPATKRTDLIPVYSFNGKQLWLNKEKGRGVLAGSATRLKKWNDLNQRLGVNRLRLPKLNLE